MFELVIACVLVKCPPPERFATLDMCQRVGLTSHKSFQCNKLVPRKPFQTFQLYTSMTTADGIVVTKKDKTAFSKGMCEAYGKAAMERALLNGRFAIATFQCNAVEDV
jgi:ABC-type branched-subunit amino acid transport system ATPase component